MGEGDNKRDVSEFNSSLAYLNRINYYFAKCAEAKELKDPFAWLDSLIIIYAELSTEMKGNEKDNFFKKIEGFNNELSPKAEEMNPSIEFQLFKDMLNFELDLRRIFKDSGLQQKVEKDPRLVK